jgi:hypothetical protein
MIRAARGISTRAAIAALFFFLGACGGSSSSSSSGAIAPAPQLRTDLLTGYYGGNAASVLEVATHASLFWAAEFYGPLEQMAALTHAKGAGIRHVILSVPTHAHYQDLARGELEIRHYLDRLQAAGLLENVAAVYPMDEPDVHGITDAQVKAANAMYRRIMAGYPGLAGKPLAVFYACGTGRRPGLSGDRREELYDWIGCDDYDRSCSVLAPSAAVPDLLAAMRPDQRLLIVAGGSSPWRQDPACFAAYAHREPRVVALLAFLWQTTADGRYLGIRENGMRALYCQAFRPTAPAGAPC